jgi:N-acetylmuramoyl-L-alanine amidase
VIDLNMDRLTFIKGTTPVLITAPHVFKHHRLSLDKYWKVGEPWTDYIASEIAKQTDSFALISNTELNYDPNFDIETDNPFKKEIHRIVDKYRIKYVIDIHGLSDKHPYDFGIFYKNRFRRSKQLAYDLASILNSGKLKNSLVQILNFYDNSQETIGEFVVANLRIPAIQLEIARYIREDEDLRNAVVSSIVKLITLN